MPQSDSDRAALEAVTVEIGRLEALCNEIELGLRANDWDRMNVAISDSRRTMHAFENAMAAARAARTPAFDQHVFARMQRIYAVRQEQMGRLKAVHDGIGERLTSISRWKAYARSIGGSSQRRRGISLLNDVR